MSQIIIGMSGGVDSAVAAKILKDQGHEVIGVFMRNWDSTVNNDVLGNPNITSSICPEELDWEDVQKLSLQIGISVQRVDFIKEYWDDVFSDLIKQYKSGRTPNPDILCNKKIKFGKFQKWVFKNFPKADYIAMGHYADVENGVLKKPLDVWKDQTYFLSQVKKEVLKKTIFPLAKLSKNQVRKIAMENNLIVANKKDSTGICFIGKRKFTKFLQNYIPSQPGEIIDITNNQVVGKHIGVMYYTIGQRKGLQLSGMPEVYYVAGHNLKKKIIYVSPQSDKKYLMSDKAVVKNVNWLVDKKIDNLNLQVKFRYNSSAVDCKITWLNSQEIEVFYPKGFEAVTPGQQAVFYQEDYCLGGGMIDKVFWKNQVKIYL